jgi:hypothetical protein
VPLNAEELEAAVREHVRAEGARDLEAVRRTLDEDVEYRIMTPAYADDPSPYGTFHSAATYLKMWENLYATFSTYDIEILDVLINVEHRRAWITLRVTATPIEDWNGLPAGKPMSWWPAAICEFDEDGIMLSETVWGSLPPFLEGFHRMRDSVGAPAQ